MQEVEKALAASVLGNYCAADADVAQQTGHLEKLKKTSFTTNQHQILSAYNKLNQN